MADRRRGIKRRRGRTPAAGGPTLTDHPNGSQTARDLEPMRLHTMLLLRWVAITGQLMAVGVADALGLRFDAMAALVVIGLSAALNVVMSWRSWPADGWHITAQLTLDVVQVAALLVLTGGLSNPFALLILAPVTIAATTLDRLKVLFLGLATVAMVSLAAVIADPVRDAAGQAIVLPRLLAAGHWVALVVAVGFFAGYAHRVASELRARAIALNATEMALAREQKLQHLGGIVAAAAHELGTPLATIKLVSSELADDLADRPELAGDLRLLRESAERCGAILRSMGRAGKDDLHLHAMPLGALLEEAAAPHAQRAHVRLTLTARDATPEPMMRRDPGVTHGLRNLIQNAVDFAAGTVRIDAEWDAHDVRVTVSDDGPGYPPAMLGRIGDPFPILRRSADARPGYEGMGLGLVIARTLLERSAASLSFRNGGPGAVVEVTWPRPRIEADARGRGPLGTNPNIIG